MSKQVSPLRQRMIDDMTFRNMSPNTQKGLRLHRGKLRPVSLPVTRQARGLSTSEMLARGLKAKSINAIVGALRFFYGTTLGTTRLPNRSPSTGLAASPSVGRSSPRRQCAFMKAAHRPPARCPWPPGPMIYVMSKPNCSTQGSARVI